MTVISSMPEDTVQSCRDRSNTGDTIEAYISAAYYVNGMGKPHYPVPVLQGAVLLTRHAVYIRHPQGFDSVAIWSRKYRRRIA